MRNLLLVASASLLLAACSNELGKYQCRFTDVVLEETGQPIEPAPRDFVFEPSEQTDAELAGPVASLGYNKNGDTAFLVMSKFDDSFSGMQIKRMAGDTINAGVCVKDQIAR